MEWAVGILCSYSVKIAACLTCVVLYTWQLEDGSRSRAGEIKWQTMRYVTRKHLSSRQTSLRKGVPATSDAATGPEYWEEDK